MKLYHEFLLLAGLINKSILS